MLTDTKEFVIIDSPGLLVVAKWSTGGNLVFFTDPQPANPLSQRIIATVPPSSLQGFAAFVNGPPAPPPPPPSLLDTAPSGPAPWIFCESCQTMNERGAATCIGCQAALPSSSSSPLIPTLYDKKTCPSCGNIVQQTERKCGCGYHWFEETT